MLVIGIFCRKKEQNIETFNVNVQTKQGIKDELIIAVFIQNIRKLVEEYYAQNLSEDVIVYNYETTILTVEKLDGGLIQIKFGVTPQVGAHNPVGYDEVTYAIDSSGNIQAVDYQHIKSDGVDEYGGNINGQNQASKSDKIWRFFSAHF